MRKNELREYDCYRYLKSKGITDIRKYVMFTSVFFSQYLDKEEELDEFYLSFVERELNNDKLIYDVIANEKKKVDIAKERNTSETVIYNYFLKKRKELKEKYSRFKVFKAIKFEEIIRYLEFSDLFFQEILIEPIKLDDFYKQFVNDKINNSELLKVLIDDNLSKEECSKLFSSKKASVSQKLFHLKEELNLEYKYLVEYNKLGYDYRESCMFNRFTKFFFPQFIEEEERYDSRFLIMVKEIVNEDERFRLFFKEGIKGNIVNQMFNKKGIAQDYFREKRTYVLRKYDDMVLHTTRRKR